MPVLPCNPLVVKPVNGFSSQGVVRVDDWKELEEAVRKVEAVNETDLNRFVHGKTGIIAEQFIDGPEFVIETLSIQGNVHVLSIGYKGSLTASTFLTASSSSFQSSTRTTPWLEKPLTGLTTNG